MNKIENYFDYAAATPILPDVLIAMQPFLTDKFYNPSALYLKARENRLALESARQTLAGSIGAKPVEIIFTAGGTEANNLAIRGFMDSNPGTNLIVSPIEHESVLQPAGLYDYKILPVDSKGVVRLDKLSSIIDDQTSLISVMYANNEIGSLQPISQIAHTVKEINADRQKRKVALRLRLHSDACQAMNYLDMQTARLGMDMTTLNSGKIYGPKQTGALFVKAGLRLKPLILGGGQEWSMRSGTQNLANIIGFAKAVEIIRSNWRDEQLRLSQIRDEFFRYIKNNCPKAEIKGPIGSKRLANNISLTMPGQDNERLLMILDENGFEVATGSACSASNDEPSHVLKAIGLNKNQVFGTLRISLGRFTTKKSVLKMAEIICKST